MAKKSPGVKAQTETPKHATRAGLVVSDAQQRAAASARADGWVNAARGLGGDKDRRAGTENDFVVEIWEKEQIDAMYANDDVMGRVVDLFPEEMTREGYKIIEDVSGELADKVSELRFDVYLEEALRKARLYGGAVLLIGANDGRPLYKPLMLDRVTSIDYFLVLDAFEIEVSRQYSTLESGKYGQPEMYRVRTAKRMVNGTRDDISGVSYGRKIHESRLIRFEGTVTPDEIKVENNGWPLSVINRWYAPVRDFQMASAGIANLIPEFGQAVVKIKGLADMMASPNADVIVSRLSELDAIRSITNWVTLDAENEDFAKPGTPVSGLADLYDRAAQKLSMAIGAPITLLTGISPAGMNATGESDHRFFYNKVGALQKKQIKEHITEVINVISDVYGIKPAGQASRYSIDFNPLWRLSANEQAQVRETTSRTDKNMIEAGVLRRSEVAISRYANGYSTETMLDADKKMAISRLDLDVTAVTAVVEKVTTGMLSTKAAQNLLEVLHHMPPEDAARLLDGVEPPEPAKPTPSQQ